MKLWKISQEENRDYDTYDSAIVVASTAEEAQKILPSDYMKWGNPWHTNAWVPSPDKVRAEYVGEAASHLKSGEVLVASFNAG